MSLDNCIELPSLIERMPPKIAQRLKPDADRFALRAQILKASVITLESEFEDFLREVKLLIDTENIS